MSLSLPFTTAEFLALFRAYNLSVWPAPVILSVLGLFAAVSVMIPGRRKDVLLSLVLAALWAWTALVYHLGFFFRINPAAALFAGLSVAAGAILIWHGVWKRTLYFGWPGRARGVPAVLLVAFALIGYPLWSTFAGHSYPGMPTFGTPCPTTLFTLGMLGLVRRPYPRGPLVVPIAWSLIGAQAAWLMGVWPDLSLLAAALFGAYLLLHAGSARGAR